MSADDRHSSGTTTRPRADAEDGDRELELGIGSVLSRRVERRLLNRDGTFNVQRRGLGIWESFPLYHVLLEMTWPRFLLLAGAGYLTLNLLFALAYVSAGVGAVSGGAGGGFDQRLWEAFFFSVQTSSTLGYGALTPSGILANLLVTLEALVGLLSFGLVSGLMFARFARPNARILFSDVAVVAPYRGIRGFMFRLINQRSTQISNLQVRVIFVKRRKDGGGREYHRLELERSGVTFFPLAWTIVHPIDENSPMAGLSEQDLVESDAEFLVLLQGFDDTFSQTVHTRTSYRAEEVVFGARFASMFDHDNAAPGEVIVDVKRLHDIERTMQ